MLPYNSTSEVQEALKTVAAGIAHNKKIQVRYIAEATPCANTKTGEIYIPAFNQLSVETLNKLRAFIYHEAGHILLSEPPDGMVPKKVIPALGAIRNALEDYRMEKVIGDQLPGAAMTFRWLAEFFNKEIGKKISDSEIKAPLWEALVAANFSLDGMPLAWTMTPEAQKYYDKMRNAYGEIRNAKDAVDAWKLSKKIYRLLKDMLKEEKQNQQKQEKQQGQKGGQGAQAQAQESGEDDGDEEENQEAGSQKGGKVSKKQSKKNSEKSKEKSEKGDEKSEKQSQEDDGEGDAKDSQDGDNEAGDKESDAENKGGSGVSGDDDDSDQEDDGKESDGDSDADGEKDDDGDDEKDGGKADQAAADELDDAAKAEDKQVILQEAVKKEIELLDAKDLKYTADASNDQHLTLKFGESDKTEYRETVSSVAGEIMGMSRFLEQALRALARCQKNRFQERGKLDRRRLVQAATCTTKRVFYTTKNGIELDAVVVIVIDESGSMCYTYQEVQRLAMVLGEVLHKLEVPFEIIGTTTLYSGCDHRIAPLNGLTRTNPIVFRHYKNFEESWTAISPRILQTSHHQNNIDGEALMYAARRLASRPESRKLIFSLSDGQPEGGQGNDHKLGQNIIRVCEVLRKNRIEVYGFGIDTDDPKKFYGKEFFLYLERGKIGEDFFQRFAEVLTKGKILIQRPQMA